ncbi:hypothetical protein H1R20_g2542, partial [Candolleomyces eurysporus]
MPGPSNPKRRRNKANGKKQQQKRTGESSAKPSTLNGKLSPEIPRKTLPPSQQHQSKRGEQSAPLPASKQSRAVPSQKPPQRTLRSKVTPPTCVTDDSSYPPSPLLTPPPTGSSSSPLLDSQILYHNPESTSNSSTSYYDYIESYYDKYYQHITAATLKSSRTRIVPEECTDVIEKVLKKPPVIHDPGNGPRVRDVKGFLKSEFFAQMPAFDDPLCAEFAQEEVLQMLQTVLPEEVATILWYNKSRATSRICPACQRLYRLGDTLPDHDVGSEKASVGGPKPAPPQLRLEQQISGICSPVCFVLASFTFPGAIKGAWGKMAEEIDDQSWDLLNASDTRARSQSDTSHALGMIVRMTRLHDLGLGQLCFGPGEVEALEVDHRHDDESCSKVAASSALPAS